jgi:hypothetical protein
MLVGMLLLLGAGNPLQAALGTAVVAAGIPVYRLVAVSRAGVLAHRGRSSLEEA